jgi:hypothetical protein
MTGMSLAQPEEPHPRLRPGVTSSPIVEKEKAPERIPQPQ